MRKNHIDFLFNIQNKYGNQYVRMLYRYITKLIFLFMKNNYSLYVKFVRKQKWNKMIEFIKLVSQFLKLDLKYEWI